jgi:membrane protease YdiL (CAAX protease family)
MLMNTKRLELSVDSETGFLREDDATKYFSTFGWFCFIFCLALFLSQEIIATAVYYLLPGVYNHYLFSNLLSFVTLYAIALPIANPILKKLPSVTPLKEKVKPSTFIGGFFVAYLTMYAGNLVSVYLIELIYSASGNMLENPLEQSVDATPLWANVLFVAILAPILEELVFRGMICKRLLALGEGFAVVFSGIFFAMLHGNLYQLFYAFTLGCLFGLIYVKTGKVIYTIIYHVFINFIGTVVTTIINKYVRLEEVVELLSDENTVNALMNNDITPIQPYFTDVIIISIYSMVIYGFIIAGAVILITNFKKIKFQSGLLPPPKKSRMSIIFLNSGIAAAIAILVIRMILPLIL